MGRRHLAALACAALLGALAASTDSSAAPAAGTLTVVIEGAFRGCDPGAPGTSPAVDAVLSLVLPSAFTSRPDGSPASDAEVFAQAEPVVPSPLTVLYTIAPGATWSNGRPLTAQDLIRTWQQRRGGGTVGDLGYRQIASITPSASGQSATVVFRDAYADWQSLFDEMVPPATFGARCELPSGTLDPSLGPYEVASASSTQVVLRENPSWTGSAPAFPDVVVTNQLAAPAAFAAPRIVYAPAPSLGTLQALTSSGSLNSRMFASSSVVSLDFATRGPFALSLLARRGVADFVDRQAIVDAVAAPVDDTAAPEASHLFGQGDGDYSGPFGSPVSHPIPLPPPVPGALGPLAYGPGAQVAAGESDLVAAGYARGPAGRDRAGRGPRGRARPRPGRRAARRAARVARLPGGPRDAPERDRGRRGAAPGQLHRRGAVAQWRVVRVAGCRQLARPAGVDDGRAHRGAERSRRHHRRAARGHDPRPRRRGVHVGPARRPALAAHGRDAAVLAVRVRRVVDERRGRAGVQLTLRLHRPDPHDDRARELPALTGSGDSLLRHVGVAE